MINKPFIPACIFLVCFTSSLAFSQSTDLQSYREITDHIVNAALDNEEGFKRLTTFVDYFPHRLSGSESLEHAIDWTLEKMENDGFDIIRTQTVDIPHWVRGKEFVRMVQPYEQEFPMLGLGGSVGTGSDTLSAEVIVVNSFDELIENAEEVKGKIVLYNVPFTSYGETVQYRTTGAIRAARLGAVGSLIRSVTPYSIQTPHTGNSRYQDGIPKIPHAAITPEHAMFLQRMQNRGEKVEIEIYMEARTLPDTESRNVIAEITGSEFPEQIITIGGHIDSWDVGQGAMDDAGGVFAAWEAARVLNSLDLKPKRTIRVVLWTNEENGLGGAEKYRETAVEEGVANHIFALESDFGAFKPVGLSFSGTDEAVEVLSEIGTLLDSIDSGEVIRGSAAPDVTPLVRENIPGAGLITENDRYFWYHHTAADTIDKLDIEEFNMCVATFAVFAYVVADMDRTLPR
ncbi:MAG: M28 family metallopeptidase [Balneolaceae bacterium]